MAAILIIDDDASARDLLKTVLGYAGHEIHEASDGAEALPLVHRLMPALIVVDLLMPRMDGMEFVRRLRRHSATERIPVVFYTASYLESQAQQLARLCGVTHFINKPAEPEQIFAVVNAALGEHGAPLPTPAPIDVQHDYLVTIAAALSRKAAHVVPRLEAMMALGLRLASERDPERLLADCCEASRKVIGARAASVAIPLQGESGLRYQFSSGLAADAVAGTHEATQQHWQTSVYQRVLTSRAPQRLYSEPGSAEALGLPPGHPPVHSLLCAPILSPQRVYGWLALFEATGGREFSDEDEALAQIVAAQVGRIYENGALYREIKQYADRLEIEMEERKQAQEEIRRINAELERRIEQRTAQLMELNSELEAFGYTVSHDLRTPLRALMGYSTMILESEAERLSERGRRHLNLTVSSVQRMTRLVDDLLAFSRLGRQALRFEQVEMHRLVLEVWNELLQQERAPAQLDLGELPPVRADPAMLREVWSNLLSNALKYSSKNPQRAILVRGERVGESVQYSVQDNGVGFNPAYSSKLFKVFERLHSSSEFEGTGAGLAIVERIVARHGGRTWGTSALGKGATFFFTLPVRQADGC